MSNIFDSFISIDCEILSVSVYNLFAAEQWIGTRVDHLMDLVLRHIFISGVDRYVPLGWFSHGRSLWQKLVAMAN